MKVYVVYACGGIRGIRMMMEVYGVYAGGGIRGGICDIRRLRYTWRYTQMAMHVVYVVGGIRGIRMMEVYGVYAGAETTSEILTLKNVNPLGSTSYTSYIMQQYE